MGTVPFFLRWNRLVDICLSAAAPFVIGVLFLFAATFWAGIPPSAIPAAPPAAAHSASVADKSPRRPVIEVRLRADAQGAPAWITVNRRVAKDMADLRLRIRALANKAGASGPSAAEVQFDCDYNLRYEYTLAALAAVSPGPDDDPAASAGLIERVSFAPRRKP